MKHIIFTSCVLVTSLCAEKRPAVIITPISESMVTSAASAGQEPQQAYATLPFSPELQKNPVHRAAQFLFNTVVYVVAQEGDEVLLETPVLFYDNDQAKQLTKNLFWVHKDALRYLDELPGAHKKAIPRPLSHPDNHWENAQVVVTILPWYSAKTGNCYSVGTRFVRLPVADIANSYCVKVYDPARKRVVREWIPHTYALIEGSVMPEKKRLQLVRLIKQWIAHAQETPLQQIPYVWGGKSFVPSVTPGVLSGFDCSSLIIAACHIVGIPFPYKTTVMMERFLVPLKEDEPLEPGDIVWIPGHVMLIGEPGQHELIQARGYTSGYGWLYASPIKESFQGIETYEQLRQAHLKRKRVVLLNKQGNFYEAYNALKILKLPVRS